MARPKSFNEADVLTRMMEVFWRQGYEATSMRHLEKASGLTAGSIYHEFGSKKALFERTLSFYISTVIGWRIDKYLHQASDPLEGIRDFLVTTFKEVPERYRWQSCLLINTAAELGQNDPAIGKIIARGMQRIETAFTECLIQARANGQLKPGVDPALAAKQLGLLLPGILIAARNHASNSSLEAAVDFQMTQLTG
ncbi:MAG: TetR/AcrR family transcriptional regulator [Ketobacteraceae bacterium]|nr:TetR/AcrR family transcriptional regulator [Ketobacteraceae bacterium]